MKRTFLFLAMVLISACENDTAPVSPSRAGRGTIEVVFEDSRTAVKAITDSLAVSRQALKPARLSQLEVRVLRSDNSVLDTGVFTPSNGVFNVSMTVEALNDLVVLCIGTISNVVEYVGVAEDVDVQPGKTTTAIISGWSEPFRPEIVSISPNPSLNGAYTVSWTQSPNASGYFLQEADNDKFSGVATVYSGTELKKSVTGKASGTYYYRVRASSQYDVASGWSLTESVVVNTEQVLQGKIAFISYRDDNLEIYVMNADGSDQRRLTNNAAGDYTPSWSPDGTHIAFDSDRDGNYEIYVMNADGSIQRRLTNNSADDVNPSWSPDGTQIAFYSDRDGNYEIYVMNADGSSQRNLSNNAAEDWYPSWSPDGTHIAFDSDRDGNYEIYVMNADGSSQLRLTNNSADDGNPSWSPDSAQIAFVSDRDGNYDIYVMNADGSNQRRLTNNAAEDWAPSWSPDGTQIAFESDRDGNYEIYVMNADGSNQRNMTNNSSYDGYPSWSPK